MSKPAPSHDAGVSARPALPEAIAAATGHNAAALRRLGHRLMPQAAPTPAPVKVARRVRASDEEMPAAVGVEMRATTAFARSLIPPDPKKEAGGNDD